MNFQYQRNLLGLGFLSIVLAACSTSPSNPAASRQRASKQGGLKRSYEAPPGTYRCIAANDRGEDWASVGKRRDRARGEALTECHKGSINPDTCHIASCTWKGPQPYPVQGQGKFTCYSKNHKIAGEWGATSANGNVAVAHSLSRCHAHSGLPKACYFSHCQNW